MNRPLDDLRELDSVRSVKKCGIGGVSYYVTSEDDNLQPIRTYWLKHLRDEYKWVGESEHGVDPAFGLLKKKL